MIFKTIISISLLALILSPAAHSSSKKEKSPVNCAELSMTRLKCYQCTDEKKYLGDVAVLTVYEEADGKKYCVKGNDGIQACAGKFKIKPYDVGFYTKYKLGSTTYSEFFKSSCVKQVGY